MRLLAVKSKLDLYSKHKRNLKLVCVVCVFLFCACLAAPAKPGIAVGASLYLSPSSGTVTVNSTFNVSAFINTAKNDINAVRVDLKFDPTKLQIVNPTAGKSFISIWVAQPTYSNIEGIISFQGGTPSPGINTSAGLVSTITFRAISPGKTTIEILDISQTLLNDGNGNNILTSMSNAFFEIIIPPPEGPEINSSTHPDPNKWYKNNNPSFSWEAEEGVTDFSYSIDQSPENVPANVSEGSSASASFNDLADGIWYFHLKAKKKNIWGGASHYYVRIDKTPPAAFSAKIEPALNLPDATTKNPVLSFLTTDVHSGIDHYGIKIVNLDKEQRDESIFFEAVSPYRLPIESNGEYEIIVRAHDQAGNWYDYSQKIQVLDTIRFFYSSKQGLGILGFFLFWWQLILVIIALATITLSIIWWRSREHFRLEDQLKTIEELKAKVAKNEQEIKSKLK